MSPSPLRTAALGEQLAALLRDRIVSGELASGVHLVEDQLAADHDVSRGPVRDALRTLQAEGLVEGRRRGFFVRGFTTQDVDELYDVREAIEALACRSALAEETTDWSDAEELLAQMRAAADAQDAHRFALADLAFHTVFYERSGNVRLAALWEQFRPTFAALLDVTNKQDADLHPSFEDHVRLLDLARERDAAGFLDVLRGHLAGSRRRMRATIEAAVAAPSPSID